MEALFSLPWQRNVPIKPFSKLTDQFQFISNFFTHRGQVGSVVPSSDRLARQMVKQLFSEEDSPRHILEVGGGSGAITKLAIAAMRDGDTLDVVECSPEFASTLRQIVQRSKRPEQIRVHEAFIENFAPQQKYTHVIASLPLLSLPASTVRNYYQVLNEKLLMEGTKYSYFEYVALPTITHLGERLSSFLSPSERVRSILREKKEYLKGKEIDTDIVWRNFPPARVVHVTHSD